MIQLIDIFNLTNVGFGGVKFEIGQSPCTSTVIDENNVHYVLDFREDAILETFNRFLAFGDKGVFVLENGRVIGHGWVALRRSSSQKIWGFLPVDEGHVAIYFCFVSDACSDREEACRILLEALIESCKEQIGVRNVLISMPRSDSLLRNVIVGLGAGHERRIIRFKIKKCQMVFALPYWRNHV